MILCKYCMHFLLLNVLNHENIFGKVAARIRGITYIIFELFSVFDKCLMASDCFYHVASVAKLTIANGFTMLKRTHYRIKYITLNI